MTDNVELVTHLENADIPVSTFIENHLLGGVMIPGTTKFETRNPNPSKRIPKWNFDSCTHSQCNQCILLCPHAAIRPFIVTMEEIQNAPYRYPIQFENLKAIGQVFPLDCN
jgi:pyruvate-ferredoxin/flavodoxin oxidoreductase